MKYLIIIILFFLTKKNTFSQTTEIYIAHKRTGIDLMWFKNFKNKNGTNTPFLFFSRTRASVDYHNSQTAFGSTNAISFNFKNGIGIVTATSFINSGLIQKAGVQLFKQKNDFMFFGWLVADINDKSNLDLFGLLRYSPKIHGLWSGFGQFELFTVYNPTSDVKNITQRLRVGIKHHLWVLGLMMDFNHVGVSELHFTQNTGGFLRYEF